MKRRITEKSEERGWGWVWVYWVRLEKVNLGRVAGQAGERVERGLRRSAGGQKGKLFLKKAKAYGGGGDWDEVLRGGWDVRGLGNTGPSNMPV